VSIGRQRCVSILPPAHATLPRVSTPVGRQDQPCLLFDTQTLPPTPIPFFLYMPLGALQLAIRLGVASTDILRVCLGPEAEGSQQQSVLVHQADAPSDPGGVLFYRAYSGIIDR
jgi:hypothetical protein